jgi:hypothetical protein
MCKIVAVLRHFGSEFVVLNHYWHAHSENKNAGISKHLQTAG